MTDFLFNSMTFGIALTFGAYLLFQYVAKKYKFFLLNPVLLTIAFIILFLKVFHVDYAAYAKGGDIIGYLLKPAVVALGVPLYLHLEDIKRQKAAILWSQLAGCIIGIGSVIFFAKLFGASRPVILSLVPKSVTTPIAMEISSVIGGIPSLTAGVVITVGILGSVLGIRFLKLMRISDQAAIGLAMGTASHGLGTAKAAEISKKQGAFGSLGLIMNGIFTAILSPWIIQMIESWL